MKPRGSSRGESGVSPNKQVNATAKPLPCLLDVGERDIDEWSVDSVRLTDFMGLLAKIFGGVPREEMDGIHLNVTRPRWELSGETDFPSLLTALPDLLPEGCVLYFEDGSPAGELLQFLQGYC